MADAPRALFCECAFTELAPETAKAEALQRLREAGVAFELVPDLCELAARRDPRLQAIAESGDALILACYPRAVRWLFAYAAAPLPESARIVNLRVETPQALPLTPGDSHAEGAEGAERPSTATKRTSNAELRTPNVERGKVCRSTFDVGRSTFGVGKCARSEEIRTNSSAGKTGPGAEAPNPPFAIRNPQWVPWFPVIDRSRCTGCQQCLNFCLFGVYALDAEGNVEVKNPANCKTNCPACARICPQVAIIFPKHKISPINGDEVTPEHLAGRELRVDPRSLARGDVYGALRRRSERARAAAEKVTEEQAAKLCPCMLEELHKELGIPPEVLQTLPLTDIQAKLRAVRGETQTS